MQVTNGNKDSLNQLEAALRHKFLPALTGRQAFSDVEREVLSLPARIGGIGVIDPSKTHKLNHWCGYPSKPREWTLAINVTEVLTQPSQWHLHNGECHACGTKDYKKGMSKQNPDFYNLSQCTKRKPVSSSHWSKISRQATGVSMYLLQDPASRPWKTCY